MILLCRTGEKSQPSARSHGCPRHYLWPAGEEDGAARLAYVRGDAGGCARARDHLLGAEGRGLAQTLAVLDSGRVGIASVSLGLAQAAFEAACDYARTRHAFGQPLTEHQAIAFMLADMAAGIEAARWLVYRAAWLRDGGRPYTREASIAKLVATEMAERVARDAIQIHGGYGYSSEYPVERIYHDARLMTIGRGRARCSG